VVCLGAGVMNMVPWGGPTARAMAALKVDSSELFLPMLPAMAAGMAWVLFAAYMIGRKERKRVGVQELVQVGDGPGAMLADPRPTSTSQRVRFWCNLALTLALIAALLLQLVHGVPLEVLFAVAFTVALLVNRPRWPQQQELLERHGYNVLLVVSMIFAAGVFTGVLEGTEMVTRMAESLVGLIPNAMSGLLPVLTAVTGMPLSLVFTPDAYYSGVLPVLAETTAALGGNPVEIGRAAILGQMTTGFPLSPLTASTFILVGMTAVNLGDHQRFIFMWAFGTTLVMIAVAVLTGAISI
jgi:CitMHS family citrate-Mg2+:H+ or citrate-Ca2+:H+ symporter